MPFTIHFKTMKSFNQKLIRWTMLASVCLVGGMGSHPVQAVEMPAEYYEVQEVLLPVGVSPEIGGLAFNSKGELVVLTRRSGILIGKPHSDPALFEWRTFSEHSMHNPMGVLLESDDQMLIPQMAELTRVRDSDGDGQADTYEAVSTAWGVSGNYHETNAGPVPDGRGNWFVAIGTASHNGPTFDYVRGEFSRTGRRGRNYSAVSYKGWVVKITPDGNLIPWASGFRANNGIATSPVGDLWVTDNQGDWRGTSPLYHVEKGHFYGHPSSLVWDETFFPHHGDPLEFGIDRLNGKRTPAAVELPHGIVCNSPAEPIFDTTGGKFGPFAGQMFLGDIAGRRIVRVMLEKVNGVYQGACVFLIEQSGLRGGNNRFAFSPSGDSLYVGQTYRGWGSPEEGLQRIVWKGVVPMEVRKMSLTQTGFDLTFTKPVSPQAAADAARFKVQSYRYGYGYKYGSPQLDKEDETVKALSLSEDGLTVSLKLDGMQSGKIYQIDLENMFSRDGLPVINTMLCYTVNQMR